MVDKTELAEKYAAERAKRIRADGVEQYHSVDLSSDFEIDPFVAEPIVRDPVTRDVDAVVVGGGWGGLLTAVQLSKEGVEDYLIVERGADFGGTWYWNRYPGLACDCESYVYLPLLEETGFVPSMRYAPGDEIRQYQHDIAQRFDIYRRSLLQTTVTSLRWDEAQLRWIVTTNRCDELTTRYLVVGTGILHRPKLPGVKGIDRFTGVSFHSSRWRFDITGGSIRGNLDRVAGKRIGVIGTGPSALQTIPHLAEGGAELYVFQRTPVAVSPRDNAPTDVDWFTRQSPGWHQRRRDNFEDLTSGTPVKETLVTDAWTTIWYIPPLEQAPDGAEPDIDAYRKVIEDYDVEQMEAARARVDDIVKDPAVAEALKPWYATHCKRPTFSDEYLQAFNAPNVHLVDTDGKGPDEITETGIVVNGQEIPLDIIIYATGFESVITADRAGGFDVVGANGVTMADAFKHRVRAMFGMQAHEFPNMFMVGMVRGAAAAVNQLNPTGMQAAHIGRNIKQLLDEGIVRHQVTEETVQAWCDEMDDKLDRIYSAEATNACTPGYFNNDGVFDVTGETAGRPVFADVYGGGTHAYREMIDSWNEQREYREKADIVTADSFLGAAAASPDGRS